MKTTAQQTVTRQERTAFGPALSRAVVAVLSVVTRAVMVRVVAVKCHLSKPASFVSRFFGLIWNDGFSIRGANPRVANG